MRHIVYGGPKRLFSFQLGKSGLKALSGVTEAYLLTQLERGFRTLEFYKQMAHLEEISPPGDGESK